MCKAFVCFNKLYQVTYGHSYYTGIPDFRAFQPYDHTSIPTICVSGHPVFRLSAMDCVKWGSKHMCLVYLIPYCVFTNSSMLERIRHALHLWRGNKCNRSGARTILVIEEEAVLLPAKLDAIVLAMQFLSVYYWWF